MFIVHQGDCVEVLKTLPDNSVDSVVTDPPYGLSSKEPDMVKCLTAWLAGEEYAPGKRGYMGQAWDKFVPSPAPWKECLRVLKPGGHMLAFFSTRTYDMGVLAIRLAGFEVRDQICWVYGSGLIKNAKFHDEDDEVAQGIGTALRPSLEPIVLVRKPMQGTRSQNLAKFGTGALRQWACAIGDQPMPRTHIKNGVVTNYTVPGRLPTNLIFDEVSAAVLDEQAGVRVSGSRKAGVRKGMGYHGGAKGDGGPAIQGSKGGASRFFYVPKTSRAEKDFGLEHREWQSAAALVGRKEDSAGIKSGRAGSGRSGGGYNPHQTVKPIALMQYLCRLVTPVGGTVLDPFCGSGTTGISAEREGFSFIGIDISKENCEITVDRGTAWGKKADHL